MSADLGSGVPNAMAPTTALAVQRRPITFGDFMAKISDFTALATSLARSGRAGESATPEKVLATMCMGAELGIPPMTAAQQIYPINGKLTISVALATSLLYRDFPGASIESNDDGQTCTVTITVPGRGKATAKFSMEDAKRAGLVKKDSNWEKYPDDMRYSKAVIRAIRRIAPDVLCGLYTREEIEEQPLSVQASTVTQAAPAPAPAVAATTPTATPPADAVVDVAFVETVDADGEIHATPAADQSVAEFRRTVLSKLANGAASSEMVKFENNGVDLNDPKRKNPITSQQTLALRNLKQEMGISNDDWLRALGRYACKSAKELTEADAGEFITALQKQKRELIAEGKAAAGATAAASSN